MKLFFFGTPEFALPSLHRMSLDRHRVVGVVTRPDRPKGRGRESQPSAVKLLAISLAIPVFQPDSLLDSHFLDSIRQLAPELAVVVAFGRLLPKELLKRFPQGAINLHASLLPKYRGAAPIPWAVLSGETQTGVSVFLLDEQLDHGPLLNQAVFPIAPNDTTPTLSRHLSLLGADLLLKTIDLMEKKEIKPKPQDDRQASLAPRLHKEDGIIDWNWGAQTIHNRVRALQPWPAATARLNLPEARLLKLLKTHPDLGGPSKGAAPGTILVADPKEGLWVQTGQGRLRIDELQEEGGNPMEGQAYLRGHRLNPGTAFVSLVK